MNRFGLKENVLAFIVEAAKVHDIETVILFGSRAKGTFSPKSDIDLAVSGERYHDFIEALDENCPTLLSFDIVHLSNPLSDEFAKRISEEGVRIYG